MQVITTNPAEICDAIDAATTRWEKVYGRMGISRPIGLVILGQAATGLLSELAQADKESSVAERMITGDEIKDLPADCIASLGTGKTAVKFSTYALIGTHVAKAMELGEATMRELAKIPGTSAQTVVKLLSDLPSMAEYRKEQEARRKAIAKRAADMAAVRLVWKFAEKFKADHNEETYAEVMEERALTWQQVSEIIATLTADSDAKSADDAAKADA
ncbi:hypothetical protein [Microbispora bryophytorum]|uniref:hypothetical protein n=1 Tax=Microbispora bryophytorum TaxID=1460882 RepID=UPI0033E27582